MYMYICLYLYMVPIPYDSKSLFQAAGYICVCVYCLFVYASVFMFVYASVFVRCDFSVLCDTRHLLFAITAKDFHVARTAH